MGVKWLSYPPAWAKPDEAEKGEEGQKEREVCEP